MTSIVRLKLSLLICGLGVFVNLPASSAEAIKIGLINSYSGFLAQSGDEMQKGIDLYLKEHEQELPTGVKIELIRRDDGAVPDTGKRVAQELIAREQVQLLLGIVGSPIAAAVAPLTQQAKIPLVITNAAGAAIPRISPYVVRVSFTLWQQAYPLGKWAAKQNWKTAYTAVSDFIPGHDAEGAFTKGWNDAGLQMLGSVRFPTNNPDFSPIVQRIRDTKPDVAFIWVPGQEQATAALKAARDFGLKQAGINVVSTQDLVPDEQLPLIGDEAIGLVSSGIYSTAADRPANKAFLTAWDREYRGKAIPDFLSADGWDGMAAVFDLIKATNGKFTGDEAIKFLSTWKTANSPRGPISIDPETRDIVQNIYMRRTEMKDGKLANIEFDTIPNVKDPWKELNPPK
ncbi:MAG: ABC transporter substrate-binding protein [Xanthobacteraceae bacterium]|nr:ABC transporter substrate-binding protein [Xanthobacteraceae bacterium]MBV9237254.1 ABC transporter substrate-binding protein [Xanthobacteraceae bacterium]